MRLRLLQYQLAISFDRIERGAQVVAQTAGLGGIHVEVLRDVTFAPVPISPDEALALIGELRGAPPADRAALAELIAALSRFAADHADAIDEIDLNPVIVHPQGEGLTVVDALIIKRQAANS